MLHFIYCILYTIYSIHSKVLPHYIIFEFNLIQLGRYCYRIAKRKCLVNKFSYVLKTNPEVPRQFRVISAHLHNCFLGVSLYSFYVSIAN